MSKKNKVLVVDDERDILEMLDYNLSKEGYEVIQAADGLSAIEIAKEELPQMILLDVMMPGMDGFEVCSRLKSSRAIPSSADRSISTDA